MPVGNERPAPLRPYYEHGVDLHVNGTKEAVGDCPFCGKENKFYVNIETGMYSCKVCQTGTEKGGGNIYSFIRHLHSLSLEHPHELNSLQVHRKLLSEDTLRQWGVCRSAFTDEWIIPGYGTDGKLNNLYRYVETGGNKWTSFATSEMKHQLYGAHLYDKRKGEVYLLEGQWDAMCLWELLKVVKANTDGTYSLTGSEEASVLNNVNILATPGSGVFHESWLELFAGKIVTLFYDSDHPKLMCKSCSKSYSKVGNAFCPTCGGDLLPTEIKPAGYTGMVKAVQRMARAEEPPLEVRYLKWGVDGYAPDKKSGYDVRDLLSVGQSFAERVKLLPALYSKIEPIPIDWIPGRTEAHVPGSLDSDVIPCKDWKELVNQWKKAMKFTSGLDCALSVMLACPTSIRSLGDQLWAKIIGPPSCGKSTLCEALSVNKKHIKAISKFTGFHSGFKMDKHGDEDFSLVKQLYNKTMITKDGDTLLQSPNLGQILSEARDIYDGTSRANYRHGIDRDYSALRMCWILCGTASLRKLDDSELGARFLDCVIMEGIEEDLEDEINWRAVNKAERNMGVEVGDSTAEQNDPEMTKAMQMTGGYINYLCNNSVELLSKVESSEESKRMCMDLGRFVAYLRARPSSRQKEVAERELSSRLVIQLMRLAKCLAVVLNRNSLDEEVMSRVRKVALDTARGRSLEICKLLHMFHEEGVTLEAIAINTNQKKEDERDLLKFLKHIGVIEVESRGNGLRSGRPVWRMTEKFLKLYKTVMEDYNTEGN